MSKPRLKTLKPRLQQLPTRLAAPLTIAETRTRGGKWMRTRERILSRDMGVCQCDECRATGAVKAATEVDHYVPLWKGGTDADENLRAINADCHRLKSAGEAAERGV